MEHRSEFDSIILFTIRWTKPLRKYVYQFMQIALVLCAFCLMMDFESLLLLLRMPVMRIRLAWIVIVRSKQRSQHGRNRHLTNQRYTPVHSPVHPIHRMHNSKICQKQRFCGIYSFHKLVPTIPTQTNRPISWIGDREILQINQRPFLVSNHYKQTNKSTFLKYIMRSNIG